MKLKVSLFLLFAISLAGCVDIPDFPDAPRIYYNGIDQYTEIDSSTAIPQRTEVVTLTIDFEDGDGDLGASPEDVQRPEFAQSYRRVQGWGLPANYELITMVQNRDSTWSETILEGDSIKFFPLLKPDGKAGPIKGKLDLKIPFRYLNSAVMAKVKFKVRIIDRAFNISNQIPESGDGTDAVTVPVYR